MMDSQYFGFDHTLSGNGKDEGAANTHQGKGTLFHIGGKFYLGKSDSIRLLPLPAYLAQLETTGHGNMATFLQVFAENPADYERKLVPFLQESPLESSCSPFYRVEDVVTGFKIGYHGAVDEERFQTLVVEGATQGQWLEGCLDKGWMQPTSLYTRAVARNGRESTLWRWTFNGPMPGILLDGEASIR